MTFRKFRVWKSTMDVIEIDKINSCVRCVKKAYPIKNASFKRWIQCGWGISHSLLNHGLIQRPRIFRRVVAEIRGKKNNLCIRTKSGWKGIFWWEDSSKKSKYKEACCTTLLVSSTSVFFLLLSPLLRRMPRKRGTLRKHSADD